MWRKEEGSGGMAMGIGEGVNAEKRLQVQRVKVVALG